MNKRGKDKLPSEAERSAADRSGRRLVSLGLPADADCRLPGVTVTGGRYVCVENHCGILQISACCVRLYSRIGVIRIEGKDLAAARMDGETMLLEGRIRAVCFE